MYKSILLHFIAVKREPNNDAQHELARFIVHEMESLELYLTACAMLDLLDSAWPSKLDKIFFRNKCGLSRPNLASFIGNFKS